MKQPTIALIGALTFSSSHWVAGATQAAQTTSAMTFFVTSVNPGRGADLGGLAGADAHCQMLAKAAGSHEQTWRAYLSSPARGSQPRVDARSRIGRGPWVNAKGIRIASNVAELHGRNNAIAFGTALDEHGDVVAHEQHDMLTGSNLDGTLAAGASDATCGGWTSNTNGAVMVGHHDKVGGGATWNSAHMVEGCSEEALRPSLGAGLFYCFAVR